MRETRDRNASPAKTLPARDGRSAARGKFVERSEEFRGDAIEPDELVVGSLINHGWEMHPWMVPKRPLGGKPELIPDYADFNLDYVPSP
jgi:hypothetical protein